MNVDANNNVIRMFSTDITSGIALIPSSSQISLFADRKT